MDKVNIPDPLEAQINALDNAFYEWLDSQDIDSEDFYFWNERWTDSRHEPIVYTSDEIYEGWGNDIEDFIETNTLVVDKALDEEIRRKTQILKDINEDDQDEA